MDFSNLTAIVEELSAIVEKILAVIKEIAAKFEKHFVFEDYEYEEETTNA